MYRVDPKQMSIYDYLPPYHGELEDANRWVRLAEAIDWDAFEQAYSTHFSNGGKIAISARVALGSLVIRAAYGISDHDTVQVVRESPYLQYFLGCKTFSNEAPFSERSLRRFRRRVPPHAVRAAVRLLLWRACPLWPLRCWLGYMPAEMKKNKIRERPGALLTAFL